MSDMSDIVRHPRKEMLMPKLGGIAACSVAKGFEEDRFAALSERDQRDLLKLMARIAEKAYRRGVQHGAEVAGYAATCTLGAMDGRLIWRRRQIRR